MGDSILRGQLIEFSGRAQFSGRAPNNRKRYCIPGARLDDITDVCGEVTSDADDNTLFIIHAGTNDVSSTRPEELLEKYKKIIRQFRTLLFQAFFPGWVLTGNSMARRVPLTPDLILSVHRKVLIF